MFTYGMLAALIRYFPIHFVKAMYRLCAERGMVMEKVFDNITVSYLSQVAAELGKDKILQVCIECLNRQ